MVKDVEKYYSQLALSVFLLTTISSKKKAPRTRLILDTF